MQIVYSAILMRTLRDTHSSAAVAFTPLPRTSTVPVLRQVDEVLRGLIEQPPQKVYRIPARPKRMQKAAAAAAAGVSTVATATPQLAAMGSPAEGDVLTLSTAAKEAGDVESMVVEDSGGGKGEQRASKGEEGDFVYDMYVHVPDDVPTGAEGGEEYQWPWLDAPVDVDLYVPVIEVRCRQHGQV